MKKVVLAILVSGFCVSALADTQASTYDYVSSTVQCTNPNVGGMGATFTGFSLIYAAGSSMLKLCGPDFSPNSAPNSSNLSRTCGLIMMSNNSFSKNFAGGGDPYTEVGVLTMQQNNTVALLNLKFSSLASPVTCEYNIVFHQRA